MSPDRSTCDIYAICELPTGETVVLDFSHNKVKLLDKKYQVLSHCYVSQYSYDLCLISSSEIVVTMNEKYIRVRDEEPVHELQMISVKNNRLYKGWKLLLLYKSIGIANHEDDLYVTSGTALYQYTLTGTLVKKLHDGIFKNTGMHQYSHDSNNCTNN
ncbi:hypothetical protein DPMN_184349 [Dreissena polymorpha]|uniref:Uncharacterized protein n=1 Tax=Dreissena polymorpha TaxID=45954 RepID=A0A9D4DIC6_DREPO|nr:hypothetical protein DPMN_184349 [Dreissena polymorpha]